MRILLLGEYSNLHHTLREALRRAGHDVLLISDGDGWKNYPRDYDLSRRWAGPLGSLLYLLRLVRLLPLMRGHDVVQVVNPDLLHLKPRWNRWLMGWLGRSNGCLSVGCFGDDYYVISRSQREYVEMRHRAEAAGLLPHFLDYTDFYAKGRTIDHPFNQQRLRGWGEGGKAELTRWVMARASCLVACLYEYYKVYDTREFQERLHYIPLPIEVPAADERPLAPQHRPLKVLLAVQKVRGAMKGTDQMEPLFRRLAEAYPKRVELMRIESVPFAEYCRLLDEADVIVDQLYSYTPAMNALEAMSRGKVVVSGGEEDYYEFLRERYPEAPTLRPIINLRPFEPEQNYQLLCRTLLDPELMARLSRESREFVLIHHQADLVAAQYVRMWQERLEQAERRGEGDKN